jgi:peptidoglycan-N-acetylglucosamine deacetylase
MSKQDLSGLPVDAGKARRTRGIALAALAVLFCLWFYTARGTGWTNAINPAYWLRRMHGEDLYRSDEALLQHGNREIPEVALTFDDGPHIESRGEILRILKLQGIKATFFDVGINMTANPDLVMKTLEDGHEIGNHSQDHRSRLDTIAGLERHHEINDADISYASITGHHLQLLRPPGMRYNDAVLNETKELGYVVVGYTTASRDFSPDEKPEEIAARTLARTENGSIILLHDYPATARALPAILKGIQDRGLKCVTISELIHHLPANARSNAEKQLAVNAN